MPSAVLRTRGLVVISREQTWVILTSVGFDLSDWAATEPFRDAALS